MNTATSVISFLTALLLGAALGAGAMYYTKLPTRRFTVTGGRDGCVKYDPITGDTWHSATVMVKGGCHHVWRKVVNSDETLRPSRS